MYNFLDNSAKRTVTTCNFNRHTNAKHPDRIMCEHDLVYIREGQWKIAQDGIEYLVVPGDVILLQAGHHHYGTEPCISSVKTCFIHFSAHTTDQVEDVNESNAGFWRFPIVVHCKNNPMVGLFIERIIYSYWSDSLYAADKAAAYLSILLSEISETSGFEGKQSSMISDIKKRIKTTPERFIGIEEFATDYHCSIRTISSKFKEATGCSLHAWQIREKCYMAEELLKSEPATTLKEIAAIFGFYDEYHFNKCFKKIIGHTPKRFK